MHQATIEHELYILCAKKHIKCLDLQSRALALGGGRFKMK